MASDLPWPNLQSRLTITRELHTSLESPCISPFRVDRFHRRLHSVDEFPCLRAVQLSDARTGDHCRIQVHGVYRDGVPATLLPVRIVRYAAALPASIVVANLAIPGIALQASPRSFDSDRARLVVRPNRTIPSADGAIALRQGPRRLAHVNAHRSAVAGRGNLCLAPSHRAKPAAQPRRAVATRLTRLVRWDVGRSCQGALPRRVRLSDISGFTASSPAEEQETPQRPEDEPDANRAHGNSIPELQRLSHSLVPDEGDQSAQQGQRDYPGQDAAEPELQVIENRWPATCRETLRTWTASVAMSEPCVSPLDYQRAEGQCEPQVCHREAMRNGCLRPSSQVKSRDCEQEQVDYRQE